MDHAPLDPERLRKPRAAARRAAATGAVALALLGAPSAAPAATTCAMDDQMLALGVVMSAPNDRATLSVGPSGRIVVSSSEGGPAIRCAGGIPRTSTTPIITVANGLAARSTRVEIHDASRFGPGLVDEGDGDDEIEIVVELGNDPDSRLAVMDDGPGGAAIRFGSAGINPNAFASEREPDADIFPIGVTDGALLGAGGAGPDSLGAQGGAGTGAALSARVRLFGRAGADSLAGGAGADQLFGDEGDDELSGGGGDDAIFPGVDSDRVNGGPGTDAADYRDTSAGISIDLAIAGPQATGGSGNDSLAGVEDVFGGSVDVNVLRGDGGPNRLIGSGGADVLEGRGGQDVLTGGAGADALDVRDGGPDSADCGAETDVVTADAPGTDTLIGCESFLFPPVTPSGGDPPGGGPPAGADVLAPAFLGRVRAVPARFRARGRALRVAARGTTFRYSLSEAATVTFAIERRTSGRRVGGACRAKSRSNARRPKCARFDQVGSFEAPVGAGVNATPFSGRIATKPLQPGAWRALLTAVDAAGNASKPTSASFRVVRRRGHRRAVAQSAAAEPTA